MFLKPPGAKRAETPEEILDDFREILIEYLTENCGLSETEAEQRIMTEPVKDAIKDNIMCYLGIWSERVVIATSIPGEMVENFKSEPEPTEERRLLS